MCYLCGVCYRLNVLFALPLCRLMVSMLQAECVICVVSMLQAECVICVVSMLWVECVICIASV